MEELGEAIEGRKLRRCAAKGLGAILLSTSILGGAIFGAHEYREHTGDRTAAESHAREILVREDNAPFGNALFYLTWPGRQMGYWCAERWR